MAAIPELNIEFFAFANVNNTIRLRNGRLLVRLSDLLEGAPDAVLRAIAHILLAKMYRQPIDRVDRRRAIEDMWPVMRSCARPIWFGRFAGASGCVRRGAFLRFGHDLRGIEQAVLSRADGAAAHELEPDQDSTHSRPLRSGAQCDHHQPDLRSSCVPAYVLEYIVYHEMLHLKHPVRLRGSRRCVHSPEFQAEEKLFPHMTAANAFLKRL